MILGKCLDRLAPRRATARGLRAGGRAALTRLQLESLEVRQLLSAGSLASLDEALPSASILRGRISAADAAAATLRLTTTAVGGELLQLQGVQLDSAEGLLPQSDRASELINLDAFRTDPRFAGIDGTGYSVVLIDTGIDLDHPFFGPDADGNGVADRIVYSYDLYGPNDPDANDPLGHGSHVASIVGSSDDTYVGLAPGVNLISLKVFPDSTGGATLTDLEEALQWIVANSAVYNVAAVNLSLGAGNYQTPYESSLSDEFEALADLNVIVTAASGNGFYTHNSQMGVTFPAADANVIAVGAVFDADFGPYTYSSGAIAHSSAPDRIAPFTQRHPQMLGAMAPGAPITAANHLGGTTTYHGTSQASPHVAGAAVLAQQLAAQTLGRRLTLAEFRQILTASSTTVHDGDDEDDNVVNTDLDFGRIDLVALADAVYQLSPGAIAGAVYRDANADGVRSAGETGLAGWTVYVDENDNGVPEPGGTATATAVDLPRDIPDVTSVVSAVTIGGLLGVIADVNVTLSIMHSFVEDIDAYLIAPDGRRVELFTDVGGNGDNFVDTVLDSGSQALIGSGAAPFTGSFRPEGKLTQLNGGAPNGQWRLEITDDENSDWGSLVAWSLEVVSRGETLVQSAADGSYSIGLLAPGSYTVRAQAPAGWTPIAPSDARHTVTLGPSQNITGKDFGFRQSASPVPGIPDLVPGSDNGLSSSDNRTTLDNSTPDKKLQFQVAGTVPGALVLLYSDTTIVGSATATGATTLITTSGAHDIVDGGHLVTTRQIAPGSPLSVASPPLLIIVDTVAPTANIIDVTPDPRTTPIDQILIRFSEPVTGFDVSDLVLSRGAGNLLTGAQTLTSSDNTTWTLGGLSGLTRAAGDYTLSLSAAPAGITDLVGNALSAGASDSFEVLSAVVGRHIFYNGSAFDGGSIGADVRDDDAIATDKTALLPGGTASFANYSSFTGGITGVMIDMTGLGGTPTTADFIFRVGNNNQFASWSVAPLPTITVRQGAGVGGSDRVTLVWPSGSIIRRWLQVSVLPSARTGLIAGDTFYFGNAPGETGDSLNNAIVNATDEVRTRTNMRPITSPADVSVPYDYNRDKLVNATDQIAIRLNLTSVLTALTYIVPPAGAAPGVAPLPLLVPDMAADDEALPRGLRPVARRRG